MQHEYMVGTTTKGHANLMRRYFAENQDRTGRDILVRNCLGERLGFILINVFFVVLS
jgi:hypothetical protein